MIVTVVLKQIQENTYLIEISRNIASYKERAFRQNSVGRLFCWVILLNTDFTNSVLSSAY